MCPLGMLRCREGGKVRQCQGGQTWCVFGSVGSVPGAPLCSSDAHPAAGTEQSGFSLLAGTSLLELGNHTHKKSVLPVGALMQHAQHTWASPACYRGGSEKARAGVRSVFTYLASEKRVLD